MEYTQDWFSHNIPFLNQFTKRFEGKPIRMLEIGSFEGKSTVWFLENWLTHKDSFIECVDTWKGSVEHGNGVMDGVHARFLKNIDVYASKVYPYVMTSYVFFSGNPIEKYDVAYIDGSHMACDVLSDAVSAYSCLKKGGVMIFDDYQWGEMEHEYQRPKLAVDSFIRCYEGKVEVIDTGYQIALKNL